MRCFTSSEFEQVCFASSPTTPGVRHDVNVGIFSHILTSSPTKLWCKVHMRCIYILSTLTVPPVQTGFCRHGRAFLKNPEMFNLVISVCDGAIGKLLGSGKFTIYVDADV